MTVDAYGNYYQDTLDASYYDPSFEQEASLEPPLPIEEPAQAGLQTPIPNELESGVDLFRDVGALSKNAFNNLGKGFMESINPALQIGDNVIDTVYKPIANKIGVEFFDDIQLAQKNETSGENSFIPAETLGNITGSIVSSTVRLSALSADALTQHHSFGLIKTHFASHHVREEALLQNKNPDLAEIRNQSAIYLQAGVPLIPGVGAGVAALSGGVGGALDTLETDRPFDIKDFAVNAFAGAAMERMGDFAFKGRSKSFDDALSPALQNLKRPVTNSWEGLLQKGDAAADTVWRLVDYYTQPPSGGNFTLAENVPLGQNTPSLEADLPENVNAIGGWFRRSGTSSDGNKYIPNDFANMGEKTQNKIIKSVRGYLKEKTDALNKLLQERQDEVDTPEIKELRREANEMRTAIREMRKMQNKAGD